MGLKTLLRLVPLMLAQSSRSPVCFHRSRQLGAWVLCGVPPQALVAYSARLFHYGCQLVAVGCARHSGLLWLAFTGPQSLIRRLAGLYPATPGVLPAVFAQSGRWLPRSRVAPAGGFCQPQFCGFSSELPG